MTKIFHLILSVLTLCIMVSPFIPPSTLLPGECRKTLRFRGIGNDGQPKDFAVSFRRPLAEPPSFDPALSEMGDEKYYRGYYQVVPNSASFKQNCAGLVMERSWGIKNIYEPASTLVTQVIQIFGTRKKSGFRAGDIVIFGGNKHVAIVTGPGSQRSKVLIESKDNEESIIRGELDLSGTPKDPIKQKNGEPEIYRLENQVFVTEEGSGNCDIVPLTVTLDVNELLKGNLRALVGASVTLQDLNGGSIGSGSSGANGTVSIAVPEDRIEEARKGIKMLASLTGFHDKPDTIPASSLSDKQALWNVTMTRKPDNPPEADPNIPPGGSGLTVDEWEKKLKEIEALLAAAEPKRAAFDKKKSNLETNAAKPEDLKKKAETSLEQLKKLKPAVDRVGENCRKAAETNRKLEDVYKSIREEEKKAKNLADELVLSAGSCKTAADVKKLRDGAANLQKAVDGLDNPAKEAIRLNGELRGFKAEAEKETAELSTGPGLIKSIKDQKKLATDALKLAMNEFNELSPLETEIRTARLTISSALLKHRMNYPGEIPPSIEKRLAQLDARTEKLVSGLSTPNAPADTSKALGSIESTISEADQLIQTYRALLCTIKTRPDLLDEIAVSAISAGRSMQSVLNVEPDIRQCESRLNCEYQLKKINDALDLGDLEGATDVIAVVKGTACDTAAAEKRWTAISDQIGISLATARNRWRDIGTSCDYRGAYEAALAIQKQYPKHPWIVKNMADIERGYKAEEQNRALLQLLIAADKARNYDEAEKILGQIDGIALPYACMIAESKKLRTQYGRGKPADPEVERQCRQLLSEIRAAISAKRLAEASQKLDQVRKDCSNVSPALFTDLGAAQRELEQAIQQAISDVTLNTGKCEFVVAHQLADQLNQVRPGSFTAAFMERLRKQAQAQSQARSFLEPGLEAIKKKDVKGAIASLKQAKEVTDLPQCVADNVNKLLDELQKRQSFTEMTEKVQAATQRCDYKEASRLVDQIKTIAPREDHITDWLRTNETILADLQTREKAALDLIKQAESLSSKAEFASASEPVDWSSVNLTAKQAMDMLIKADSEAPKCMSRQQMETIRQRLNALATRKKPEIAASIALLIDTSGSMGDNKKILQAKEAARRAARQVSKTTEIAILNFDGGCGGGAMQPAAPFTTDLNELLNAIDRLKPGGGTPMYISTAEAVAYTQTRARGKQRTVVLMSDGGDTCRDEQAKAAAAIRSSSIPVSTIGFDVGNNQQAQGDLGNLAAMTGGRTFSASAADPREIIRAFNIAMLPTLLKDLDFGSARADLSGYFSQAKSLVQQQNISGALMSLQQANRVAPDSANLNFNLSLLYEADDQLLPAVNHANNYLRLAPGAVDRADVENRIGQIQQELQKNPRIIMDSSGCKDILTWAQGEREVARRTKDAARTQAILEILITSQRGDCDKARPLADSYKGRYR